MLSFLRILWPGRRMNNLPIVLYTRRGCHLCDEAWRLLLKEQARWHFSLEIVDIDTNSSLAAQFADQVPVVTVNGEVRFWGKINSVLLTRLLRAESKKG